MLALRNWDFDEMFRRFERDLTDLVGRTFGTWTARDGRMLPPVEVLQTEGELLIRTELPGIDPERLDVTVQDGVLSIRAEREFHAPEGAESVRREFAYGLYERQVALPEGVDPDTMTARYEGGILEIRVPHQATRAVKVPVEVGSGERKALKATA